MLVVAGALLLAFIIERVLHATSLLSVHFVISSPSSVKTSSAMNVFSSFMLMVYGWAQAAFGVVSQIGSVVSAATVPILTVMAIGYLGFVFQSSYPDVLQEFAAKWNSGLGTTIRTFVMVPLWILDILWDALIPVYNGFVYWSTRLLYLVVWPSLQFDFDAILRVATGLRMFFESFVLAFYEYLKTFETCYDLSCFEPGLRTFDFITPMKYLQVVFSGFTMIIKDNCGPLTAMFDLLSFPFLDVNFAKGVHLSLNSILYTVFQVPAVTINRCDYTKNFSLGVPAADRLMCVPDFEPSFIFLTAGLRHFGRFFDNWFDITMLVTQELLGFEPPQCSSLPLEREFLREDVFGQNLTAVVGLTDSIYAITDGYTNQYTLFHKNIETIISHDAWPIEIDPLHGVAAVQYVNGDTVDDFGVGTTAMLGCRCDDVADSASPTGSRMQIQCGISPFEIDAIDSLESSLFTVPVEFGVSTTAYYMLCSETRIRVESVRWPLSRFSSADLRDANGMNLDRPDQKLTVDAMVFVQPFCRGASQSTVCIDRFVDAQCYPYCMAARPTSSANSVLTLYDADDWLQKIQLLQIDCLFSSANVEALDYGASLVQYSTRVQVSNDLFGGVSSGTTTACVYNPDVISRMPKMDRNSSLSRPATVLRGDRQPFVTAGDVILTHYFDSDTVSYYVRVDRLIGDQNNEFTLETVNNQLPALPPCDTLSDCTRQDQLGQFAIPYAYAQRPSMRHPSAASEYAVFYATNPSLDMFQCVQRFCLNTLSESQGTNCLQFVATSTYHAPRVWRVDAYAMGRTAESGRYVELTDPYVYNSSAIGCGNTFDVAITDMEYLNADNVAVTVMRAKIYDFDFNSLQALEGRSVSYEIHYLNPRRMELSKRLHLPESQPSTVNIEGVLCPGVRRFPQVGSMFFESTVTLVQFIKPPLNFVVNFVSLVRQDTWSYLSSCPSQPRGHHLFLSCGRQVLDFSSAFESVERVNHFATRFLPQIANSVGTGNEHIVRFVNGFRQATQSRINPLISARLRKVIANTGAPVDGLISILKAPVMRGPNALNIANKLVSTGAKSAQFFVEFMTELAMKVVLPAIHGENVNRDLWNTVTDMQERYDSLVLNRLRQSAVGVRLMLGYTNPVAKFVFHVLTAEIEIQKSLLNIGVLFFVYFPILECMCRNVRSDNFKEHALDKCYADAPDAFKGKVMKVIQSSNGFPKDACIEMAEVVNENIERAFDPFIVELYKASKHLSGTINYLTSLFTNEEDCLNVRDNTNAVSILPFPVDYFRQCGRTDSCRGKCQNEFEAFEFSRSLHDITAPPKVIDSEVESLFFVGEDPHFMPFEILSVIELQDCEFACGRRSVHPNNADRCAEFMGIGNDNKVQVSVYCLPVEMSLSIRNSSGWTIDVDTSSVVQASLVSTITTGTSTHHDLVALRTPTTTRVVNRAGKEVFLGKELSEVNNMFVIPGAGASLVALHGKIYRSEETRMHTRCYTFTLALFPEHSSYECDNSLFSSLRTHKPVCVGLECVEMLLMPISDGHAVKKCSIVKQTLFLYNCVEILKRPNLASQLGLSVMQAGFSLTSSLVTIRRQMHLSMNTVDTNFPFRLLTISHPDSPSSWLQEVRIQQSLLQRKNSMLINSQLQIFQNCDIHSCGGCVLLDQYRLCYAAQQCALSTCVATVVNIGNSFCSFGVMLKQLMDGITNLLQNVWILFSENIKLIIDLSTGKVRSEIFVSFPTEIYYNVLCQGKDLLTAMAGVVGAQINLIANLVVNLISFIATNGQNSIDKSAAATIAIASTAVTRLTAAILHFPVYLAVALQKSTSCLNNDMLAVVDPLGITVRVGSKDVIGNTSAITKCASEIVREGQENLVQQSALRDIASVLGAMLDEQISGGVAGALGFIINAWDAFFAWLVGIVRGIQDVLQSIYQQQCKLPDRTLMEVPECACGDDALKITRRSDGLEDTAFWCTGVLELTDSTGGPFLVYNPFSLETLLQQAGDVGGYLHCLSTGGNNCRLETPIFLENQGVNSLQVIVRCRTNYLQKQWDTGAALMFSDTPPPGLNAVWRYVVSVRQQYSLQVTQCMQNVLISGESNLPCMRDFIDSPREQYFAYRLVDQTNIFREIDACKAFSGPARLGPLENNEFRKCLDDYNEDGCRLQPYLWFGKLSSNVEVATSHNVDDVAVGLRQTASRKVHRQVRESVVKKLKGVLGLWERGDISIDVDLFSAEGDILHQTFDCMLLGPYSKASLWPTLDLPHPVYHRDSDGSSRKFELQCENKQGSPFTCGSDARRSMIRYFVRDVYGSGGAVETVRTAVAEQLREMIDRWDVTPDHYECGENGLYNLAFCDKDDPNTWVPDFLQVDFTAINGTKITESLRKMATQWNWVTDNYFKYQTEPVQWSETEAIRAAEKGYWSSDTLYTWSEVNLPNRETVWDMCTGLVAQHTFSLPLKSATETELGNMPTELLMHDLERTVSELTAEAFRNSPFYWHDVNRHIPSDSAMCQSFEHNSTPPTELHADPVEVGTIGFTPPLSKPLARLGYMSATLGNNRYCLCGWSAASGCYLPAFVCDNVREEFLDYFGFECGTYTSSHRKIREFVVSRWVGEWDCPDAKASDHWGVVQESDVSAWMLATDAPVRYSQYELFTKGIGGIKPTTFDVLTSQKLPPLSGDYSLRVCESNIEDYLDRVKNFSNHWLDDQFPVSHIKHASVGLHTCVRYAIEFGRLDFMRHIGIDGDMAEQEATAEKWKHRCKSQLEAVAFCKHYGVYDVIVHKQYECPFKFTPAPGQYLTKNCLIYDNTTKRFSDPCLSSTFVCSRDMVVPPAVIRNTHLPFDIRDAVEGTPHLHWAVDHNSSTLAEIASAVRDYYESEGPWSVRFEEAYAHFDFKREGPMRDAQHDRVDGIVDWWPDDWTSPVGYHVTMPCHNRSYRTFSQAFALTNSDGLFDVFTPTGDWLRDRDELGTFGFCRQTNVGRPRFDIDTIEVCTRGEVDPIADPSVPLRADNTSAFTEMRCKRKLPFTVPSDSSWFRGMGLVYDWRDIDQEIWPSAPNLRPYETEPGLGACRLPDLHGCSSAQDCRDLSLDDSLEWACFDGTCVLTRQPSAPEITFDCVHHNQCVNGTMCSGEGRCVQPFVEVENLLEEDVEFQWFAERCPEGFEEIDSRGISPWQNIPDFLKGHGMCGYRNWIEYRSLLQSSQCNIDELLRVCDEEPEYCQLCNKETRCTQNCDLDGATMAIQHTSPLKQSNQGSLFQEEFLKLHPHPCDRDYMHIGKVCRPINTKVFDRRDQQKATTEFSSGFRTYNTEKRVDIPVSSYIQYPQSGFLGFETHLDPAIPNYADIRPCSQFRQCFLENFTVDGREVERLTTDIDERESQFAHPNPRRYTMEDQFTCGPYGKLLYETGTPVGCVVDMAVAPLYRLLCVDREQSVAFNNVLDSCPEIRTNRRLETICANLRGRYIPNSANAQRANIKDSLNALINEVFTSNFFSFDEYRARMNCAIAVYENMNREPRQPAYGTVLPSQLYFFTEFGTKELPFHWWVKCYLLSSIQVSETGITSCPAWDSPLQSAETGISMKELLQRLVGGFDDSYISTIRNSGTGPLNHLRDIVDRAVSRLKSQYSSPEPISFECYEDLLFRYNESDFMMNRDYVSRIYQHVVQGITSSFTDFTQITINGEVRTGRGVHADSLLKPGPSVPGMQEHLEDIFGKKLSDPLMVLASHYKGTLVQGRNPVYTRDILEDSPESFQVFGFDLKNFNYKDLNDELLDWPLEVVFPNREECQQIFKTFNDQWSDADIDVEKDEFCIFSYDWNNEPKQQSSDFTLDKAFVTLMESSSTSQDPSLYAEMAFPTTEFIPVCHSNIQDNNGQSCSVGRPHTSESLPEREHCFSKSSNCLTKPQERIQRIFLPVGVQLHIHDLKKISGHSESNALFKAVYYDIKKEQVEPFAFCPTPDIADSYEIFYVTGISDAWAKDPDGNCPLNRDVDGVDCFKQRSVGQGYLIKEGNAGAADLKIRLDQWYRKFDLAFITNYEARRHSFLGEGFKPGTANSEEMYMKYKKMWEFIRSRGYYEEVKLSDECKHIPYPYDNRTAGFLCWPYDYEKDDTGFEKCWHWPETYPCTERQMDELRALVNNSWVDLDITPPTGITKLSSAGFAPVRPEHFIPPRVEHSTNLGFSDEKKYSSELPSDPGFYCRSIPTALYPVFTGETRSEFEYQCPALHPTDDPYRACGDTTCGPGPQWREWSSGWAKYGKFDDPGMTQMVADRRGLNLREIEDLIEFCDKYYYDSENPDGSPLYENVEMHFPSYSHEKTTISFTEWNELCDSARSQYGKFDPKQVLEGSPRNIFSRVVDGFNYSTDTPPRSRDESFFFLQNLNRDGSSIYFDVDYEADMAALEVRLAEGFVCLSNYGTDKSPEYNLDGLCPEDQFPVIVRQNLAQCTNCTRAVRQYCKGRHTCGVRYTKALHDWMTSDGRIAKNNKEIREASLAEHFAWIHEIMNVQMSGIASVFDTFSIPPRVDYPFITEAFPFDEMSMVEVQDYVNSLGISETNSDPSACANTVSETVRVDYRACNNHPQLLELKRKAEGYKFPMHPIVPRRSTLLFDSKASQLLQFGTPAYALANREDVFVDSLLNFSEHCAGGNRANSMCLKKGMNIKNINPWTGGVYNPLERCDTTFIEGFGSVVDSICNDLTCLDDNAPFYAFQVSSCASRNAETVSRASVSGSAPNNLCSKTPKVTQQCEHTQGPIGNGRNEAQRDLYVTSTLFSQDVREGIFTASPNPFFLGRFKEDDFPILKQALSDIGGHHIEFAVDESGLHVRNLVLSGSQSLAEAFSRVDTKNLTWYHLYRENLEAESARIKSENGMDSEDAHAEWECPFRVFKFYSQEYSTPFPMRSVRYFGSFSHPTQAQNGTHGLHWIPYTSDGFCFCDEPHRCQSSLSETRQCSLIDTMKSLYDHEWRSMQTRTRTCHDQVDWPYIPGMLRDGNEIRGRVQEGCSVLERLPEYQYLYRSYAPDFSDPPPRTNIDKGGECYTGRSVRLPPAVHTNCKKINETDAAIFILCGEGDVLRLDKTPVQLPESLVEAARERRQNWATCPAVPTFETPDGRESMPETSFGIPWRVSADRFLASKLASIKSDQASWGEGFTQQILTAPHTLFHPHREAREQTPFHTRDKTDDSVLFQEPWVYTSSKGVTGTIPRGVWENPKQRPQACFQAFDGLDNSEEAAPNFSLCDLSSDLDFMCRTLLDARTTIADANCHAAGVCPRQLFAYYPATFSISNREFIHTTVDNYYDSIDPDVCPVSADTSAIREQNRAMLHKCPSVVWESIVFLLESVRVIGHTIAKIAYHFIMLCLNILNMANPLSARLRDPIGPIVKHFRLYVESLGELFAEIGNLIFRMVMETPLGEKLLDIIAVICDIINYLYYVFVKIIFCNVLNAIIVVLQFIYDLMEQTNTELLKVASIVSDGQSQSEGINLETFAYLINTMERFKDEKCGGEDYPLDCKLPRPAEDESDGALPVVTRCWTEYFTSLGDDSSLTCTAADTCRLGGLSSDSDVCDACPQPPSDDFRRFGCDTSTKMCTCGVQVQNPSGCVRHTDCQYETSECEYVNDLEQGFGSTPCDQCLAPPRCVLQAGESVGTCSCFIQDAPFATCSQVGELVAPDPLRLCLLSDGAVSPISTDYSANYDQLLSTPCANMDFSRTFCYNVFYGRNRFAPAVVGFKTSGRRLLGEVEDDPDLKWKTIGRAIITKYNLTISGDFLVSFDSIMTQLSQPHTARQLLRFPLWWDVLQHSALWAPVRRLYAVAARWFYSKRQELSDPSSPLTTWIVDLLYSPSNPSNFSNHSHIHSMFMDQALYPQNTDKTNLSALNISLHRRLQGLREDFFDVDAFTANVIINKGHATQADISYAGVEWPPVYKYWQGECGLGKSFLQLSYRVANATAIKLGTNISTTTPTKRVEFPKIRKRTYSYQSLSVERTAYQRLLDWIEKQLHKIGLGKSGILSFFETIPEEVRKFTQCDFEGVLFCKNHRYTLPVAIFVITIIHAAVAYALGSLGVPFSQPACFLLIPTMVLFYAYEYSPFCFPMIPHCILRDVLDALNLLLPEKFSVPPALERHVGCFRDLNYSSINNATTCAIDCTQAPFLFDSWESTAGWWLADTELEINWPESLHNAYLDRRELRARLDAESLTAFRACASIASWQLIPGVILASVGISISFILARFPLAILGNFLQPLTQSLHMTHIHRHPRGIDD